MSFLLRVFLPDAPGSLGRLAASIGEAGGDIRSVDVVTHNHSARAVVDDVVVDLPATALPDTLITAAQQVDGVEVDSIRPFSGSVNRSGQVAMLASIAQASSRTHALQLLVDGLPTTMSAGWAIVLSGNTTIHRVAASVAAPEDNGTILHTTPVTTARHLDPEDDDWLPESWTVMDSALAATPISDNGETLVIGRPGGPDFLAGEVEHLGKLGTILSAMMPSSLTRHDNPQDLRK